MGILDYIKSEESLAETAQLDDKRIIEIWKAYLQTVQEKGDIILKLKIENVSQHIKRLRELLTLELAEL